MKRENPLKPIKVTVSDPETGAVFEEKIVDNDYMLLCAGNRYLKSVQTMGRTHMLAVAVARVPSSRRCDSDLVTPEGDCMVCNAIQGEACRRPAP